MVALIAIAGFTWIIYQINWEKAKRVCKKLRMTVKMWITSISPEFNFKTRMKCDTRRKYNNKKRCRRYISAKRKGKTTKIGNKSKIRYTFLQAKPAVYVCSKITTDSIDPKVGFDTGSYSIGVDNHASRTISNRIAHFITPLTPTPNTILLGAGGNLKVKGMGTLQWKIEDDYGKVHIWTIKESLYVSDISTCLLSPQHWAKQAEDNSPRKRGTWCATYDDACEME